MGSPLMAFAMEGLKIALLLLLAMVTNARVNYSGYQVFRVQVENMEQAELMEGLNREGKFDFWTEVRLGRPVDVMTSPENRKELETWLGEVGIHWSIMVEDVGVLMEAELVESKRVPGSKHNMDWTSYHALEDIYGWLEYLEETYDFAQTESIGQSYEGQDMIVMKVCKGECGNKPAMWIDSGIHAREWISPAVGTWMLSELVENDSAHPELTENLDWYFLPSHNPDGYRKSRNDDRMWRKTTTHYSGDPCQGTDANRNWDYHWAETGASHDSCSQTYHGPEAFSEVEARNVRDFVLSKKSDIKFYQTLHSYSQFILMPWGYTETHAPGYENMLAVANKGNGALHAVHKKNYEVGCIPCILYTAAGTSLDWALGVAGIPYVYSIELRDTGHYGFILPTDQIIPTSEEVWAFHKVAAEEMLAEFGRK